LNLSGFGMLFGTLALFGQ